MQNKQVEELQKQIDLLKSKEFKDVKEKKRENLKDASFSREQKKYKKWVKDEKRSYLTKKQAISSRYQSEKRTNIVL